MQVKAVNQAPPQSQCKQSTFSLKTGGLFIQKIDAPSEVIQENFCCPAPGLRLSGAKNGRRMQGVDAQRKAVSLLDLSMRLRDLEARAKQRLSCRRSEAYNQFRLDGFQFCFQPWRLRSQRKERTSS